MRNLTLAAPLAIALLMGGSVAAYAAEKVDLLIVDATVIDVASGQLKNGAAVAVRGDTIVAVKPTAKAKAEFSASQTVDAKGRFVMPGLWDNHVHFGGGPELIDENKALLPLYVAHGITTVRDASGDLPEQVLAWRGGVASGALLGPTIFSSGPKIEGVKPMWKGTIEVGTEAEADAALDKLQSLKVDFVKITENTLTPQLFVYTVKQAKARGLITSAHIPAAITVDTASEAGLSSIEHMGYALRLGSPQEAQIAADVASGKITGAQATIQTLASFDEATAMAGFSRLAARGTYVSPTLNGSKATAYLDQDDHRNDPYLAYIGKGLQATYAWRVERAAKDDAAAIARRHAVYEKNAALVPMLQKAGVSILAGTDAGFLNSFNYPGIGLHDELKIYVDAGLSPLHALQASVINGPRFLGHADRYGAIAAGKAADILILDRNPIADITATRAIGGVVMKGQYFDRKALDDMLKRTAEAAAHSGGG
ncbi:imidazolonepropionase-like amidohydrolase [Phenylobacterium haematophilum]|uniref:Imidazolonepropionase-like amidohydrolase n=1 Tax=Phenylobacterium haematophilum TaxID=98513 RepID=A0A839ZVD7_9CAUL|nr:amidohydrolase family protein [Phenylobacterium haematophilum]MBB3890256.1 imidazolonepropionase-like amidohydrolase [Phenylobacterium haematophilum]